MVREGVPRRFMEANDIQVLFTPVYCNAGLRLFDDCYANFPLLHLLYSHLFEMTHVRSMPLAQHILRKHMLAIIPTKTLVAFFVVRLLLFVVPRVPL
jgi:hypothetical protein